MLNQLNHLIDIVSEKVQFIFFLPFDGHANRIELLHTFQGIGLVSFTGPEIRTVLHGSICSDREFVENVFENRRETKKGILKSGIGLIPGRSTEMGESERESEVRQTVEIQSLVLFRVKTNEIGVLLRTDGVVVEKEKNSQWIFDGIETRTREMRERRPFERRQST